MKNTDFFLSYLGHSIDESKISLITRDGIIVLAKYSDDEYCWKLEQTVDELESLTNCLNQMVKGHVQLIDGVTESIRHSLMVELSGMLQVINTTTHEEFMSLQKIFYSKIVEADFINDCNTLTKYLVDVMEAPAIQEFKLSNEWVHSTWKNTVQTMRYYQFFQDYDKEFQRIYKKLSEIKGESEELSKNKENYEENYQKFQTAQIYEGSLLEDDFRMGKEQVVKLLSNKYSSFSDVVNALN